MAIILDTDFLYSFFVSNQINHNLAKQKFNQIKNNDIYVLKLVQYELATVLSYKENHNLAKSIISDILETNIIFIDISKEEEMLVWREFYRYKKNKISFVDCANLTIAKKRKLKILSFDKFYPKELII